MGAGTTSVTDEGGPAGATIAPPDAPPLASRRPSSASHLPLPLALATLGLTYWCVDIVAPALPAIRDALALSGTGAGLVFALFFAGRLVANLPAALLVDRVGPRRTAAAGAALLLAGSLLAAIAGGEVSLLPARALQGTGVALLVTAGLLSTLRTLPAGGAAMTAFNLAAGLGGSAGLVSGGRLTDALGWRAVFLLSALLGAALLAGALVARDRPDRGPAATAPNRDDADAARVPRRALAGALAANLLVYANYSIWVVALALYATDRFDADAGDLGLLLLAINVVHLAATVPAGRVIRRAGARPALAAGFALVAAGLLLVPLAPSAGWLLAPMALYAVGGVAGNSAAGDLVLRLGGGGGRAVGFVRLTSDVGLVAGPAAVGALADAAGTLAPFLALAALSGLAAALAFRSPARR